MPEIQNNYKYAKKSLRKIIQNTIKNAPIFDLKIKTPNQLFIKTGAIFRQRIKQSQNSLYIETFETLQVDNIWSC